MHTKLWSVVVAAIACGTASVAMGAEPTLPAHSNLATDQPHTATLVVTPPAASPPSGPSSDAGCGGEPMLDAPTLFKKVAQTVVVVHALDAARKEIALGSGVVVGPGLVATNAHVVDQAVYVVVSQGSNAWRVLATSRDRERDVALLRVLNFELPTPMFGSIRDVRIGDKVFAIGAPRGLESTLSDGIVSGLRGAGLNTAIQITAAISPGSSGGGVFNERGCLIGLSTLLTRDSQNLNFALPVDWVFLVQMPSTLDASISISAVRDQQGPDGLDQALDEVFGDRGVTLPLGLHWGMTSDQARIIFPMLEDTPGRDGEPIQISSAKTNVFGEVGIQLEFFQGKLFGFTISPSLVDHHLQTDEDRQKQCRACGAWREKVLENLERGRGKPIGAPTATELRKAEASEVGQNRTQLQWIWQPNEIPKDGAPHRGNTAIILDHQAPGRPVLRYYAIDADEEAVSAEALFNARPTMDRQIVAAKDKPATLPLQSDEDRGQFYASINLCVAKRAEDSAMEQIRIEQRNAKIGGVLDSEAVLEWERIAGRAKDVQRAWLRVLSGAKVKGDGPGVEFLNKQGRKRRNPIPCSDSRIKQAVVCVDADDDGDPIWSSRIGCDAPELQPYRDLL